MGVVRFIIRNLDHFKSRFILIFITGILDGAVVFLIPVVLTGFTKGTLIGSDLAQPISLIILLYIVSLAIQWATRKWGESLGSQFGDYMRSKYFKSLSRLSHQSLINQHSGYILSVINKVSDGLEPIIVDIFWTFARSISTIALFFYFTARESVFIAFMNLVILVLFIAVSTILSRKMVPIASELNKRRGSLLESYTDFISNILTVKRLGIYDFAEDKISSKTSDSYAQIKKIQTFHANRWLLLHSLFAIAFLSTISFLLIQVSNNEIPSSALILFIAAYATVKGLVERLSESFKSLMEMKAYIATIDQIMIHNDNDSFGSNPKSWHQIKFREVFFEHPGNDKKISIPSFDLQNGQKICISGPSGQGKSTFLNLFMNFLEPNHGERTIDGTFYENISRDFFENHVATVSQETELFNISLRDNLTLGRKIRDAKLLKTLDELDLISLVQSLEKGLDTVVGEKGSKLSAGQRQRINLARGILLDRDILLLDEPTSNLDSATEAKVVEFLERHMRGRSAIIVSHREALNDLCSRHYVIKDSVLAEKNV